ncbi:hypothetical protein PHMEG_00020713 [Phytophthora megakarya]|uniref:Uncharacterized protein n=1 Tax=Phytophthora megakarya TaxID=4795 RepID=A0A225VPY9_9STRA|nr:hypothetical protein PHMEG_00020713 [Phytophthora megakarya]
MPENVGKTIRIAITRRADLAKRDKIVDDAEEMFEDENSGGEDSSSRNAVDAVAHPLVLPR